MSTFDLSGFDEETEAPAATTPLPPRPGIDGPGLDMSGFTEEPEPLNQPLTGRDRQNNAANKRHNRPAPPDEWALANPEMDQLARIEAGRMFKELEESGTGNPEAEKRATLMGDSMTLGAPQKIAGYAEVFEQNGFMGGIRKLINSEAQDDREYGERVWKYYLDNLREDVPGAAAYELGGALLTPGGARSIPGAAVEGAALSAADTTMRNTPSEGLEGVADAAAGGALISGGASIPGRMVADLPEGPKRDLTEQNTPEAPESAGDRFSRAADEAIEGKKGQLKDDLETAIREGDISYSDRAGARLQFHVRSNISDDLASMPQNQGLASNFNDATTPESMAVLAEIDKLADEEVLDLRKLDNLMNSLRAGEKRAKDKADKIVLGKIRDRITSFTDIAEYNMITKDGEVLQKVFDGDPKALADWKKAHAELGAFKDKFRKGSSAEGRLYNIAKDTDMTGKDLADYTWGLNKAGEKRKSRGMVRALKENFGEDSEVFLEYRRGMAEVLQTGTPKKTADRIANFLESSPDLAAEVFTPKQLKKLRSFAGNQQAIVRAQRNNGSGNNAIQDLLGILTTGGAAGAISGNPAVGLTAALARASQTDKARKSGFAQAVAETLAQSGKVGAIQGGDNVGEAVGVVDRFMSDDEMEQNALPGVLEGVP